MSHLGRLFLAVFALFVAQSIGRSNAYGYGEYDDWFYDVGRPSSSSARVKCRKDLLLIVDTSYSVGRSSFRDDVKPFLQRLVNDQVLNVGRDGTQISLIIFSQEEKTKLLLNFGDMYDAKELSTYIHNLRWSEISGDSTRTDLALKIANEKVFPIKNPKNNRPDVDDVVVLITDGAPRGKRNTKAQSIKYAKFLKNKGVLVIGAAVGPKRRKFKHVLEQLASSKEYVLEADFKDMDRILGRLVASSCVKPGECICDKPQASIVYVAPGHSKATISWPVPGFSCMAGRKPVITGYSVEPRMTSPHAFSVGKHTVTYRFKLKGGVEVICPLNFNVKGEMCRGISFNSKAQVCCCGTIHARKSRYECCGPVYYNIYSQKCCRNANLASRKESCPEENKK